METLRLLKLHGSLNWYWRSGDVSGVSVARRSLPGYFGSPKPYSDEERRREVPGRSPFVVPPASSKSDYYLNPIVKEMWAQASQRLRAADRVVIVGYSLPATDVTFSNMLRDSLLGRQCHVDVVDFDAAPVRDRLVSLGIEDSWVGAIGSGETAVEEFVGRWAAELSRTVSLQLRHGVGSDARLVLAWGDRTAYSPVESLELGPEGVTVGGTRVYNAFSLATSITSHPAMSLGEAANRLRVDTAGSAPVLQARLSEGDARPVVAATEYATETGQGTGNWLVIQVAATPPRASQP